LIFKEIVLPGHLYITDLKRSTESQDQVNLGSAGVQRDSSFSHLTVSAKVRDKYRMTAVKSHQSPANTMFGAGGKKIEPFLVPIFLESQSHNHHSPFLSNRVNH